MTRAIRIHQTGGPEVLQWEEIEVGAPGPGQVRLQQKACGLNYIDVYGRSGLYPVGDLPAVLGMEAVGVVDALGADVDGLSVGDRVAYGISNGQGSYAELKAVPTWHLFRIPDSVSFETAGAVMQQGMTAHYLANSVFKLGPDHTALIHAAAGGTGLLLVQMAKRQGATVIGTVSSDAKVAAVEAARNDILTGKVTVHNYEDDSSCPM